MKQMICFKCGKIIDGEECYGLHHSCYIEAFQLETSEKFTNLDPKKKDTFSSLGKEHVIGQKKDSFYHGRYLKYTAQLGQTRYILKIQEDKYPELPAMEYLCNSIASLLSLPVSPFFLIRFSKRPTFVTRNFMEEYKGGVLHHLYKFLPEGENHYTCQNIIKAIFKETNKWACVRQFTEICLFDAFIGNNDRHGRNLGIIETPKNKMLAPLYDNPSYFGIIEDDLLEANINPSGAIRTSFSKEPKIKDYLKEFSEDRELNSTCQRFKNKLYDKFKAIIEKVHHSHISGKRKKSFCLFLEKNIQEVENE